MKYESDTVIRLCSQVAECEKKSQKMPKIEETNFSRTANFDERDML